MTDFRIGHGFDVHRLVTGRPLIIGGITIPFERGLEGHSDADVLLHAIADALLGAAALGDIGQQFPPDDDSYKNADSAKLLSHVRTMVSEAGFAHLVNVDAVIMAEAPKMNPHIPAMRRRIAEVLHIDENRVGLKATTSEKLGFTGRGEGIAASAVCLISAHE